MTSAAAAPPPHEAIRSLLYRYCELMDAGDFDGLAALFTDATLTDETGTVVAEGQDGARRLWAHGTQLHDGSPCTRHITANSIIEVDAATATATARSSYVVLQAVAGELALQPIICGRYQDRFAFGDSGWYFVERRFYVDQVGDLSHHLTYSL